MMISSRSPAPAPVLVSPEGEEESFMRNREKDGNIWWCLSLSAAAEDAAAAAAAAEAAAVRIGPIPATARWLGPPTAAAVAAI